MPGERGTERRGSGTTSPPPTTPSPAAAHLVAGESFIRLLILMNTAAASLCNGYSNCDKLYHFVYNALCGSQPGLLCADSPARHGSAWRGSARHRLAAAAAIFFRGCSVVASLPC